MKTSTHSTTPLDSHSHLLVLKTKGVPPSVTEAEATMVPHINIMDLRGSDVGYSLKDELVKGLADSQLRTVPGETPADEEFAYTRTLDTLCLCSPVPLRSDA